MKDHLPVAIENGRVLTGNWISKRSSGNCKLGVKDI